MRILIINDKLMFGGAEIYILNLKKILENNKENQVKLMTFDNKFETKIGEITNNQNIVNLYPKNCLGKINKFIFNLGLYCKIRKEIKKFNPDKIILNNIFYSPITQIRALKGYDVYQVVHDYSIVCPKSTCVKENFDICKGYKTCKCVKECKYHSSKISMILKLYLTKKMEKLRKKYIKQFVSPSECLNKYLLDNGYNSICINNPIEIKNRKIELDKEKFINKKFIFVGEISERKGIFKFLNVFVQFAEKNDVTIDLIGKIDTLENEKKLSKLIEKYRTINYIGYLPNEEVLKKVRQAYCLVVPSLWIENYPTTILEAQLQKTLVIGSNRGGIPEMLQNNRGYIFDINNKKDIYDILEKINILKEEEYEKIINNAYEYVCSNNSYELYKEKLQNILIK